MRWPRGELRADHTPKRITPKPEKLQTMKRPALSEPEGALQRSEKAFKESDAEAELARADPLLELLCTFTAEDKARRWTVCSTGVTLFHATPFCTWLKPKKRGILFTPPWRSKSRCSRLSSTRGGWDWAFKSPLEATHQARSRG